MINGFGRLLQFAMRDQPLELESIITQEFLHYVLLDYMQQAKLLHHLVLMHDAALRICHGSPRLYEGLILAGNENFSVIKSQFENSAPDIQSFFAKTYGLEAKVFRPNGWQNILRNKIMGHAYRKKPRKPQHSTDQILNDMVEKACLFRLEVSMSKDTQKYAHTYIALINQPSIESEKVPAQDHHKGLICNLNLFIPAMKQTTILAEYLFSMVRTQTINYPYLWDIGWLSDQGVAVNPQRIAALIELYSLTQEQYLEQIEEYGKKLTLHLDDSAMLREMTYLLPHKERAQMQEPLFKENLILKVRRQLDCVTNRF